MFIYVSTYLTFLPCRTRISTMKAVLCLLVLVASVYSVPRELIEKRFFLDDIDLDTFGLARKCNNNLSLVLTAQQYYTGFSSQRHANKILGFIAKSYQEPSQCRFSKVSSPALTSEFQVTAIFLLLSFED